MKVLHQSGHVHWYLFSVQSVYTAGRSAYQAAAALAEVRSFGAWVQRRHRTLERTQAELALAQGWLEAALAHFREVNSSGGIVRALLILGWVCHAQGACGRPRSAAPKG